MENSLWIDHLASWKSFLYERLASTEDYGDQIRIERQIKTIERVQRGAVLNPLLLSEFINPSNKVNSESLCEEYYLELNDSQKRAVSIALETDNLSLIQGPPGTGKTQVIAEICLQLLNINPEMRILVCSETHVAVNNLISRITEYNDNLRVLRIRDKESDVTVDEYSPDSIVSSYLDWASMCFANKRALEIVCDELQNEEYKKSLEKALALSANITGMTCNRSAAYIFRDTTEMFDVVIIDEVCKANLPEILSPLMIAKKAILIGDPKQLPPVFCSEEKDIIKSIEGCQLDKYMYIDNLFKMENNCVTLDTQYRMTNQIGNMISNLFYSGLLKNGKDDDSNDGLIWIDYEPSQQWPEKQSYESERPRIYNRDECKIIAELVDDLLNKGDNSSSIAVITPYRGQVSMLRKYCSKDERVRIDTVDGFQGKECDTVIFSITRTYGPHRFIADERRLNVALSRAKNRIVIVGNENYCNNSKLLQSLIKCSCTVRKQATENKR